MYYKRVEIKSGETEIPVNYTCYHPLQTRNIEEEPKCCMTEVEEELYTLQQMIDFANWYGNKTYESVGDCGNAGFLFEDWKEDIKDDRKDKK